MQGIYMAVHQLENGIYKVENQYSRVVLDEGNQKAQELIGQVFRTSDRIWRGIDLIPESGYELRAHYRDFDARHKFNLAESPSLKDDELDVIGELLSNLYGAIEVDQQVKSGVPRKEALNGFMQRVLGSIDK